MARPGDILSYVVEKQRRRQEKVKKTLKKVLTQTRTDDMISELRLGKQTRRTLKTKQ